MKKIISVLSIIASFILFSASMHSCKISEKITSKSGAQIWGENCLRCHNAASPDSFSDEQWEVATMHMQIRANLTVEEANKVVAFLQSAN